MVFWLVIWDSTCTSSNAQEQSQRDQGRRGGGVVVVAVVVAVCSYDIMKHLHKSRQEKNHSGTFL